MSLDYLGNAKLDSIIELLKEIRDQNAQLLYFLDAQSKLDQERFEMERDQVFRNAGIKTQ